MSEENNRGMSVSDKLFIGLLFVLTWGMVLYGNVMAHNRIVALEKQLPPAHTVQTKDAP